MKNNPVGGEPDRGKSKDKAHSKEPNFVFKNSLSPVTQKLISSELLKSLSAQKIVIEVKKVILTTRGIEIIEILSPQVRRKLSCLKGKLNERYNQVWNSYPYNHWEGMKLRNKIILISEILNKGEITTSEGNRLGI